ncbi:leucine-rich melanocyte differentiation-associated protein-like isoform X1 [Homalodisca vitripennis]|uniref:leucine-rich melanocyte differentiation-associated protein-like isoform X1 n=1 Tax=Homalodisca vitripennis TaxID=197043 RepID=UPI001EEB2770|nr:leucine-rich melanocyte differentiation-associated protein-like isoform X1 [Homalodisca vitripennis]
MPVSESFSCTFTYTLAVVTSPQGQTAICDSEGKGTPKRSLALAATDKNCVLSHVCFTLNVHSLLGNIAQLSYVGQDVHRIPPILSKLYGERVFELDLSYNSLTNLQELGNFRHLTHLVLDNNQLGDSLMLPPLSSLHTLSLNKNNITNLDLLLTKIEHNTPNIKYLSLLGNLACPNQLSDHSKDDEDYQRYRYYVLHHLPRLQFLDSRPVSQEEREEARRRGRFMKVIRPAITNTERQCDDDCSSSYSPLPPANRDGREHQGMYGKCRFRYVGKHSEGNRFIQNNDL